MSTIALLLLAIIPIEAAQPVRDRVDMVERQWVTDSNDDLVFCQLIFWDWNDEIAAPVVRAWRLVDLQRGEFEGIPFAIAKGPELSTRMLWSDKGVLREVLADQIHESIDSVDYEQQNRDRFPQELRQELSPGPARTLKPRQ